jgi:hypothetical protein
MIGKVKDSAYKAVLIRVEISLEVRFLCVRDGVRLVSKQARKAIRIGRVVRGREQRLPTVARDRDALLHSMGYKKETLTLEK